MKMQVTLTPEEVEQAIKEYLFKKFKTVEKVKIEVGRELRGHYTNEYYETVFKGATCEVDD